MCGIITFVSKNSITRKNYLRFEKLLIISNSRGKDSAGIAAISDQEVLIAKNALRVETFLQSKQYAKFERLTVDEKLSALIAQTRMVTHGSAENSYTNQPIIADNRLIGVFNGILPNVTFDNKRAESAHLPADSNFLFTLLSRKEASEGYEKTFEKLSKTGLLTIIFFDIQTNTFYYGSNNGSLYQLNTADGLFLASERFFLEKIFSDHLGLIEQVPKNILHKKQISINNKSMEKKNIRVILPPKKHQKISRLNQLSVLTKHTIDFDQISKISRCKKCVLPITTPFISFDDQGICNYCQNYVAPKAQGLTALQQAIGQRKLQNGKCLVAFSGGRDSSYGLHFVKNVLGLDPVAYTYDWGMMTDMGRRNQARMLGKLGVEHILVAADIAKKRADIRRNILAWMKRPTLGMIPIFMQGDKQAEFFADQVTKRMRIPLMFYFRGNEYEREEFKAGHAGIAGADRGGVIHDLEFLKKVKLASYYARNFLQNPAYFNRSLADGVFGFFSTFVQPHDYLYLWHYIQWDEQEILGTLKNEYNWESPTENISTWRTDDATSAFYNYIYLQVQGFTENDSFRSHQVRNGVFTRKQALQLVFEENKPRYEALKWYFDTLDLDGDRVLNVVDGMGKLY